MNDPRIIEVVQEGATYQVPTYKVGPNGIEDGAGAEIKFCKGNKEDEAVFRQEGFFVETLIEVCRTNIAALNVGELATRESSMAVTKLDEALMWLQKRSDDRKRRGVQGTYKK